MNKNFMTKDTEQAYRDRALDPKYSVIVSASAGTGKTTLLKDRYISLLLNGVKPEKILCLTYTNAAAREMKHRILLELNRNLLSGDDTENHHIRELYDDLTHNQERFRIKTIHSFCLDILRSFPSEAKLEVNFQLLDQNKSDDIINTVIPSFIAMKKNIYNDLLLKQFISFEKFGEIISELLEDANVNINLDEAKQQSLISSIESQKSLMKEAIKTYISQDFGDLLHFLDSFQDQKLQKKIDVVKNWLNQDLEFRSNHIWEYLKNISSLKKIFKNTEYQETIENASIFMEDYLSIINSILSLELTLAYDNIVKSSLKEKDGYFISFNNIILKAKNLLENKEYCDWVLYSLDSGIDHILLDEAQDTNILQWSIIDKITEEFFSGRFHENPKTIFIVGDVKQSIYSFQGSDPEVFLSKLHEIEKKLQEAQLPFVKFDLNYSYRSARSIINLVNDIFAKSSIFDFLNVDKSKLIHESAKDYDGVVKLFEITSEKDEEEFLYKNHAISITKQILELLEKDKNLSPGDITILVTKRGKIFNYIINELNSANLPNTGHDRFALNDSLIVSDMLNIARFAIHPDDKTAFIAMLKSPIFSLNDKELEQYLQEEERIKYIENNPIIKNILDNRHLSGTNFFINLITKYKNAFITSYKEDYDFVTNAFIENLIDISLKNNIIDLASLVEILEYLPISLYKDSDLKEDKIRIITSHGAKGLEAPIVILADTTTPPINNDNYIIDKYSGNIVLKLKSELRSHIFDNIIKYNHTKNYQEYLRLLYVAITRAKDQLYITGVSRSKNVNNKSWYGIIANLLK